MAAYVALAQSQHRLRVRQRVAGVALKCSQSTPLPPHPLQDANVFVSEAEPGVAQDIVLAPGRQAYLVCIEHSLAVGTGEAGEWASACACTLVSSDLGKALPLLCCSYLLSGPPPSRAARRNR